MNINEIIQPKDRRAVEPRDDRPGDVITTFFNGWTFNRTGFERDCAVMRERAAEHQRLHASPAPRKLSDDQWDDRMYREEMGDNPT